MLKDFKKFVMRGNVLDMAVGVVLGGAFGSIISSLVNDIILPLLAPITGALSFSHLAWVIEGDSGFSMVVPYGVFLQTVFNFLAIAFSIFMIISLIEKTKKKEPPAPEVPAEPAEEILLLREIRDALKEEKN